ncbi:two component transcriptional regulator, LytTR family [Pustulibacterium marinum]|uniref:Two component transcriptional regulator, LytTR family n=1 Tax=Pustulibacterium marinum TaxID=1224947 RepID=A0A1I7GCB1_9FLAO|nr:LytTR family DNA-binding domain-containing protein [Pustulibacterium marinum]SFU46074.1 two component transcriptional regulator, LytTR family [Pustulibacterium marinum]
MITAIALDDEPLALDIIEAYCNGISLVSLQGKFTSQQEAIDYLYKENVDLLFLDIEMPGLNGIELYKSLKNKTKVIFTTAYSEYAIEGFNVNAIDYLLKPMVKTRFIEAVEKAHHIISLEKKELEKAITHITVKADYKTHQVALDSILFLEGLDDYVKIHRETEKILVTRSTLKKMLEKLPTEEFIRVHRSYIISKNKVSNYYKQTLKIGTFTIPVGNSYKENVQKIFE